MPQVIDDRFYDKHPPIDLDPESSVLVVDGYLAVITHLVNIRLSGHNPTGSQGSDTISSSPRPQDTPSMKNLFQPAVVQELKDRVAHLRPDSPRLWGKMTPGQAVAHCALGMELAMGDRRPPRMLIGRLIGGMIKARAFQENEPMRRNSPTIPGLAVTDDRNLDLARDILCALIDRFAAAGPAGCTTHPHSFFGYLTADEWSMWMYKHIDHHLQQFGV